MTYQIFNSMISDIKKIYMQGNNTTPEDADISIKLLLANNSQVPFIMTTTMNIEYNNIGLKAYTDDGSLWFIPYGSIVAISA